MAGRPGFGWERMKTENHYEQAFAAWMRVLERPFVSVRETARVRVPDTTLKNPDFLVYGREAGEMSLIVDIKGRKYPGGSDAVPLYSWQNWVGEDDIVALSRWEEYCGPNHRALLVFVYCIARSCELPEGTPDLISWRGDRYLLRAIAVDEYRAAMRVRSPRWHTVHLPAAEFRARIRPFSEFLLPQELPF